MSTDKAKAKAKTKTNYYISNQTIGQIKRASQVLSDKFDGLHVSPSHVIERAMNFYYDQVILKEIENLVQDQAR